MTPEQQAGIEATRALLARLDAEATPEPVEASDVATLYVNGRAVPITEMSIDVAQPRPLSGLLASAGTASPFTPYQPAGSVLGPLGLTVAAPPDDPGQTTVTYDPLDHQYRVEVRFRRGATIIAGAAFVTAETFAALGEDAVEEVARLLRESLALKAGLK